jgi:hypothetical protein
MENEEILARLESEIKSIERNVDLLPFQKRSKIMKLLKKYPSIMNDVKNLFSHYRRKRKKYDIGFDLMDFLEECLLTRCFTNTTCFIILMNTYSNDIFLLDQKHKFINSGKVFGFQ